MSSRNKQTFTGGCHCGAVQFEVDAPDDFKAVACNCSVCTMTGYLHLIVPANDFRLLAGREKIQTYTFNTGVAQHYFCGVCGIKSFYVPRSNPDGISVNVRCLKGQADRRADELFDGQNWEANAGSLKHLSDQQDPE